jgi:hypothetical protein
MDINNYPLATGDDEGHINLKFPFPVCVGAQQKLSACIWKTQTIQKSLKEKCKTEEMKEVNQSQKQVSSNSGSVPTQMEKLTQLSTRYVHN